MSRTCLVQYGPQYPLLRRRLALMCDNAGRAAARAMAIALASYAGPTPPLTGEEQ